MWFLEMAYLFICFFFGKKTIVEMWRYHVIWCGIHPYVRPFDHVWHKNSLEIHLCIRNSSSWSIFLILHPIFQNILVELFFNKDIPFIFHLNQGHVKRGIYFTPCVCQDANIRIKLRSKSYRNIINLIPHKLYLRLE